MALISYTTFVFSQEQESKKQKKFELGLQISTPEVYAWNTSPTYQTQYLYLWGESKSTLITAGAFLQYEIKEHLAFRLRASYTFSSLKYTDTTHTPSPGNYSVYQFEYNQNISAFAPGIVYKSQIGKIVLFGSAELPIKSFGKIKKSNFYFGYQNNVSIGHNIDSYVVPGGIAFGIGGSIGIKYVLGKRLLIGPEFSEAFLYHYVNGTTTNSYISYDGNGNLILSNTTSLSSKKSGIMLPLHIFSLNVSYKL